MNLPTLDSLIEILILIIFVPFVLRLIYRSMSNELGEISIGADRPLLVIGYAWWAFLIFSFLLLIFLFGGILGLWFDINYQHSLNLIQVALCIAFIALVLFGALQFFMSKRIELYNDRIVQSFIFFFKTKKVALSSASFNVFFGSGIAGITIFKDGRPRFLARAKGVAVIYSFCSKSDKISFFETLAKLSGRSAKDLEYPGTLGALKLMKDNTASSPDLNRSVQSTTNLASFDDEDEDEDDIKMNPAAGNSQLPHDSYKHEQSNISPTASSDEKLTNTIVTTFGICFYLIMLAGSCLFIYSAIKPPVDAIRFILIIVSGIQIRLTIRFCPPWTSFDKILIVVAILLIVTGIFLPEVLSLFQ